MSEQVESIRNTIKLKQLQRLTQMEPGRLLDMLVETYVMGHHVEAWGDEAIGKDYWFWPGSKLKPQNREDAVRVPNYSTADYAATLLLAKFRHWRLEKSEGRGVTASFADANEAATWTSTCPTFPEAAAKAALSAMIIEQHRIIDVLLDE